MNECTRELLDRYFRSYNARNVEGLLELVHDDLVHDIGTCRREVGKRAFARFLATKNALYDEHVYELDLLISPDGSHAAAEYTVLGFMLVEGDANVPLSPGETYRVGAGTFFHIRDGLISRISSYGSRHDLWGQAA